MAPFDVPPSSLLAIDTIGVQSVTSGSGYFQATGKLNSNTDLILGARYTWEEHWAHGSETITLPPAPGTVISGGILAEEHRIDSVPTFRIALDHQFSDTIMAYVSFNKGFKSGGFSATTFTAPTYAPETLKAYEIGVKSDLLNRRLQINAPAFIMTTAICSGQNRGGIDCDHQCRSIQDLWRRYRRHRHHHQRFEGDRKPRRATHAVQQLSRRPIFTPGGGVPLYTASATGNQLPLASKFTSNISINYTVPVLFSAETSTSMHPTTTTLGITSSRITYYASRPSIV